MENDIQCGSSRLFKQLLIYQVQEHRFGGLGADVLDKLRDIETDPLLQPNPQGFVPGTKIIRNFGNVEYTLTALKVGFDLNGVFYPTLSPPHRKVHIKKLESRQIMDDPGRLFPLTDRPQTATGKKCKEAFKGTIQPPEAMTFHAKGGNSNFETLFFFAFPVNMIFVYHKRDTALTRAVERSSK